MAKMDFRYVSTSFGSKFLTRVLTDKGKCRASLMAVINGLIGSKRSKLFYLYELFVLVARVDRPVLSYLDASDIRD